MAFISNCTSQSSLRSPYFSSFRASSKKYCNHNTSPWLTIRNTCIELKTIIQKNMAIIYPTTYQQPSLRCYIIINSISELVPSQDVGSMLMDDILSVLRTSLFRRQNFWQSLIINSSINTSIYLIRFYLALHNNTTYGQSKAY